MAGEDVQRGSPQGQESWASQMKLDDETIHQYLTDANSGSENPLNINHDQPFSQEGKADDAQDYDDISDDDLPDEEDATGLITESFEAPGLTDDNGSNDIDYLFDDSQLSSPIEHGARGSRSPASAIGGGVVSETRGEKDIFALNFPEDIPRDTNQDPSIPPAIENEIDLVKAMFPTFEKGKILDFNEQLAPKPLQWNGKQPPKPPKPLLPTKLSLEFEQDSEKHFRIPGPAQSTKKRKIADEEARGYVSLLDPEISEEEDNNIFKLDLDDDDESVGGFHLRDFELVCEDWDELMDPITPESPTAGSPMVDVAIEDDEDDEWDRGLFQPPVKKRKIVVEPGLPTIPRFSAPSFYDFEEATARAAKRVYLDFRDPYLLFEENDAEPPKKRPKLEHKQQRMANGRLGRDVTDRFNYANDQAYEQLKENHQSKIRAALSSVQVEHSTPALKLLWPYYSIRQFGVEPHDYHRPSLKISKGLGFSVRISKPHRVAKKEWKSKKVQALFAKSKDLSLNDNSTAVLFEYAEEVPTVLSNFGMGNKIINYYRRISRDDEEKPPKPELGDQSFLLPEDKSPFSLFGSVDPGDTVPTLSNPMFHAPIFKHKARETDFLFGRTTTGQEGTTYYLRKIDHLFVVGQNFPLVEVPGPHSRKVTNLTKNRLRMVAYRLIHRKGHVNLGDITAHIKDSNDAQNRQKLKEFLAYDRESRSWGLNPGENLMDLYTINTMIKPEEVCNLEAMQTGQNELSQNGYQVDDNAALDDDDDDNTNLANKMVPWKTTKNFLEACSGKAMLALKGDGDPTGRGLGFSFIKTSMKGGFMDTIQGPAATSEDAIERERKANGGHAYNVKKQDELYRRAIRKIWNDQRDSLEDEAQHDDEDIQPQEDEDDRFNANPVVSTPAHIDESMSQMSRPSMSNVTEKRKLRIAREYQDVNGEVYTKIEIVHDPGVISQYLKQRAHVELEGINPYTIAPTGNSDYDRVLMQKIDAEEQRLNRNKDRRQAREQQKARAQHIVDGDPDSPAPSVEKGGTSRKCANCGQKGHIKTNKKLCPMLNGTWKGDHMQEEGAFGVLKS